MREKKTHLYLDGKERRLLLHSLCDCDEHKRVQRYAKTCQAAASDRKVVVSLTLPTENIGQLPISP